MKKLVSLKQISVLTISTILLLGSLSSIYGQTNIQTVSAKKQVPMKLLLANLNMGLNSDNIGLRKSTVENVGRYKISNFEDKLIEMFEEANDYNEKETIALSLFQIGSLKSIDALKKAASETEEKEVKNLCDELLDKYEEYEKIRREYFNNFVVSMVESE